MTCGIYSITNKLTGQMYIGQSINIHKRFYDHACRSSDSYIGRSIKKYGLRNFIFKILFECSEQELNNEEIKFIRLYNTFLDKKHYNLTPGGDGFRNGTSPKYHVTKAGIKFNKQRYLLLTPRNMYLKSSYDNDYLEDLATQLNKGVIDEKDLLRDEYRIIKNGKQKENNKQIYAIRKINGEIIRNSVDKDFLLDLLDKLLNHEICEEDIDFKTYKIVKNGKPMNKQRYSLVDSERNVIQSSVNKKKLEDILDCLLMVNRK